MQYNRNVSGHVALTTNYVATEYFISACLDVDAIWHTPDRLPEHFTTLLEYSHSQNMTVERQRKRSLNKRTNAPDRYDNKWISILFLLVCVFCAFMFLPVGVKAQGQDNVVIGIGELSLVTLHSSTE